MSGATDEDPDYDLRMALGGTYTNVKRGSLPTHEEKVAQDAAANVAAEEKAAAEAAAKAAAQQTKAAKEKVATEAAAKEKAATEAAAKAAAEKVATPEGVTGPASAPRMDPVLEHVAAPAAIQDPDTNEELVVASTSTTTVTTMHAEDDAESRPPGKRYDLEDPMDESWRLHKKHIFILSSAGKPIFARYGDESKLSTLTGVLQAIVSFFEDNGDEVRTVVAGRHRFVFLIRGPLYLVAVTSNRQPEAETRKLLSQLHLQIISILTGSVERIFSKNASYDLRGLLGGTDRVLRSLIHTSAFDPALLLDSSTCLVLPPAAREQCGRVLLSAKTPDLLFAMLVAKNQLVHLVRPKKVQLQPGDIALIHNFVNSSTSFRDRESWVPFCLPHFNDRGFLYAHISFLVGDLCLLLISTKQDVFPQLAEAKQRIDQGLRASGLLGTICAAIDHVGYKVEELAIPELRHFLYKLQGASQWTMPRLSAPYNTRKQEKELFRQYQHIHGRMHSQPKPHKLYYQVTDAETILGMASSDSELYAVFGPLVSKPVAIAACHRLHRWLKKEQSALFIKDTPTW